jgi:cytochrome P450
MTHGLVVFDEDRALRAKLIADPALVPAAVEEVLRTHSPTLGLARTAMADAVIGGQVIHQGDRVLLAYHSGNVDDANFPRAELIDLERKRSPHLTFGRGTHFCLGNWLARLELRIAFQKVLETMPDYTVDKAAGTYTETIGLRNAWTSLPVIPRP